MNSVFKFSYMFKSKCENVTLEPLVSSSTDEQNSGTKFQEKRRDGINLCFPILSLIVSTVTFRVVPAGTFSLVNYFLDTSERLLMPSTSFH